MAQSKEKKYPRSPKIIGSQRGDTPIEEEKEKKLRSILKAVGGKPNAMQSQAQYMKYKDLNPSEVHEGTASYGGSDYSEALGSTVGQYSVAVKRGESKTNFIFGGQLYQIDNPSGSAYSVVKV